MTVISLTSAPPWLVAQIAQEQLRRYSEPPEPDDPEPRRTRRTRRARRITGQVLIKAGHWLEGQRETLDQPSLP